MLDLFMAIWNLGCRKKTVRVLFALLIVGMGLSLLLLTTVFSLANATHMFAHNSMVRHVIQHNLKNVPTEQPRHPAQPLTVTPTPTSVVPTPVLPDTGASSPSATAQVWYGQASPTAMPVITPTPVPTSSASATPTPTPTPGARLTPTPTVLPTATVPPTPTVLPTPTVPPTPKVISTATLSPTAIADVTASASTPLPTLTPEQTPTGSVPGDYSISFLRIARKEKI